MNFFKAGEVYYSQDMVWAWHLLGGQELIIKWYFVVAAERQRIFKDSWSSNIFSQPSPESVLKILDTLLHAHVAAHFPFPP